MSNALEDLVVENRASYPEELTVARGYPRNGKATDDLKGDPDRLARLAELADVDQRRIVDVAVRGTNVTFVVSDGLNQNGAPSGAVSSGFFPLADLDSDESADRGRRARRPAVARAPQGGSATVPSVTAPNRGSADTGQVDGLRTGGVPQDESAEPNGGTLDGDIVPDDLDGLNAKDTAALFKRDDVNKRAVLDHELARQGDGANDGPRSSVLKAAASAGFDVPQS